MMRKYWSYLVLLGVVFSLATPLYAGDDLPVLKRSDQFFGKIISGTSEKILLADRDLVVTNFGSARDVQVGDKFNVYEPNIFLSKDEQGRRLYEKIGEVTLIKVFDNKSVAKVTRSFKEVFMELGREFYLDPLVAAEPVAAQQPAVPLPQPAAPEVTPPPQPMPPEEQRIGIDPAVEFEQEHIYFAFDDAGLTDDSIKILKKKAGFLLANRERKTLIEGHCDERGSVEYNLALGERRAASARNYLIQLGVEPNRMRTISYGKERPLDPDHTEEAWAKNRRCQFVLE